MKSSIEAQALLRRNFEEQNSALDDFKTWEAKIKDEEAKIKKRKSKEIVPNPSVSDTIESCESGDDGSAAMQIPQMFRKSTSVVIGGSDTIITKNAVPAPPIGVQKAKVFTNEELATQARERGNELFATGDFEEAKKCYSQSIVYDSSSALAYSNRAMVNLKLKDWHSAESDATTALRLDVLHFKSLQRRSAARMALGKVRASLKDLYDANSVLGILNQKGLPAQGDQNGKLPQEISTKQAEAELIKVMNKAPRREVAVQVQKAHIDSKLANKAPQVDKKMSDIASSGQTQHPKAYKVKNWLEFEQIWKSLKSSQQKLDLLQSLQAKTLVELYRNGMEDSGLLLDLVTHCSKCKHSLKLVKEISLIPSIDMLIMMMSKDEKEKFVISLQKVLKRCNCQSDVQIIKQNFGLS